MAEIIHDDGQEFEGEREDGDSWLEVIGCPVLVEGVGGGRVVDL